jgi:hypothetical protein
MQVTAFAPPRQRIEGDTPNFLEQLNRTPFPVRHNLAGSPLFELPSLL